jgi:glutamate-5-semialdehyde dehydrogenase
MSAMDITGQADAARAASRTLAVTRREVKDVALNAMADALLAHEAALLEANAADVAAARESGTGDWMIDRLALSSKRVAEMAEGLRSLARLADPVGDVVRGWTNPNGVAIRQVRVPFGVVGIIYEARPNVTADAAGICLKSGNAVLLCGSRSAERSNLAVVAALREGLESAGLPADSVQLLPAGREASAALMAARGKVDVLVPRGGAGLIAAVVEGSKVPVIETGTGNCHLYVDATADLDMAAAILVNAKTQRPSVCNSVETLLVHEAIAAEALPKLLAAVREKGVTVHGDQAFRDASPDVVPAGPGEYDGEYLTLDLAARVVPDLDAALEHIRLHTTGHSETIITRDLQAADRFVAEVDAAVVLVNASSRFTDGGEFGFGAEIGISTQKLHARGPMALPEMTSTKYVVTGQGQTRP